MTLKLRVDNQSQNVSWASLKPHIFEETDKRTVRLSEITQQIRRTASTDSHHRFIRRQHGILETFSLNIANLSHIIALETHR